MEKLASMFLGFSVKALPVTKLLPIFALVAALSVYAKYRRATDGSYRSFALFLSGLLATSIALGLLGIWLGIAFFCTFTQSNLCGLGGFFFAGPFAFCFAVVMYMVVWIRRGKSS